MKRILVSFISIISFVALSADHNDSSPLKSHVKNFSILSKSCDFDISQWTNIEVALNPNDVVFFGDVLFKINNSQYKTQELHVKNFYLRSNCEIKSNLVTLVK